MPLIKFAWAYRTEILLAVQLVAKLRRTAQEVARDYVRRRIETGLRHSLKVVGFQILLFVALTSFARSVPGLGPELLCSVALWAVSLFNLLELTLVTIPEIRALRRTLRGKTGYALKYLLEVSLVTELMRLNVLFLAFCLAIGVSSRTYLGAHFSYTRPWAKLWRVDTPVHKMRN